MTGRYRARSAAIIQGQLLKGDKVTAHDLPSDCEEDHEELLSDSNSEENVDDEHFQKAAEIDFKEESESDSEWPSIAKRENNKSGATPSRVKLEQNPSIFCGEDGHQWYTTPQEEQPPRLPNTKTHVPGPVGKAKNVTSPLDAWSLLFTDELLKKLVKHTNEEIERWRNVTEITSVTSQTYNDLTLCELKALLGLFYFSGLQKAVNTNVDELWSNEFGSLLYRTTMASKRFEFLFRMIRFDDKLTRFERRKTDKFAPIRELWEDFISKCTKFYTPTSHCTIDEQVLFFQGRCPFKVNNSEKPDKCGIKVVMLNDSRTFYMYNAEPYVGAVQKESTESVPSYYIRKLSEPIHGSWRNITCDNWFSSTEIFDTMSSKFSITMVGTLRKNKRQIPSSFKSAAPVKSSEFLFDGKKTLVKYIPKKNKVMLVLSSLHHVAEVDEDQKPDIVSFYNDTKEGTDCFDHMCREYTTARKTLRWPLRFWFGMLDQGAVNALILHNYNCARPNLLRREFLKNLVKGLIEPHLRVRLAVPTLRRVLRTTIEDILEIPIAPVQSPPSLKKAKRCCLCPRVADKKVKIKCQRCSRPVCEEHRIVLCTPCSYTD